jgi:hypothetical protein
MFATGTRTSALLEVWVKAVAARRTRGKMESGTREREKRVGVMRNLEVLLFK